MDFEVNLPDVVRDQLTLVPPGACINLVNNKPAFIASYPWRILFHVCDEVALHIEFCWCPSFSYFVVSILAQRACGCCRSLQHNLARATRFTFLKFHTPRSFFSKQTTSHDTRWQCLSPSKEPHRKVRLILSNSRTKPLCNRVICIAYKGILFVTVWISSTFAPLDNCRHFQLSILLRTLEIRYW